MGTSLRRAWIAFAATMLTSAAPSAFGAPGFLRPAAGDRLEPGTLVEVLWNLDGVPSEAEESELILSLDGGRTFPIRVTSDFDPAMRRILWRVPVLPTDHARLALRAGHDEEPAEEMLRLIGPPFVISGSAANSALEELFAVGSEFRTREALEVGPRRLRDTGLRGVTDEQIHAGLDREVAVQGGARIALLSDPLAPSSARISTPAPQRAAEPALGHRSCPTPLRV